MKDLLEAILSDADRYGLDGIWEIDLDEKMVVTAGPKEKKMVYDYLFRRFIESNPTIEDMAIMVTKIPNKRHRRLLKYILKRRMRYA